MAKLDTLTLCVADPEAQRKFYCDILGMSEIEDRVVSYSDRQAAIKFVKTEGAYYDPKSSDLYWKIALSVPNIELACEQLQASGVDCSDPHQFRDVGYLAHFKDPEGFPVELIDHHFKGERPTVEINDSRLGGGAHLSLITLRVADISAVEPEILNWGMKPLSVQTVEPRGFTLHFYAFTDEIPPNADLHALQNRTWVYQRPYTVLEIQHVQALEEEIPPSNKTCGYGGISVSGIDRPIESSRLRITGELNSTQTDRS